VSIVTDDTEGKQLNDLIVVFSELLEKFLQHFGSSVSRPSWVTTVPCQTVKNGPQGRQSIHSLSRWTIMCWVRLFDLEHLCLFSTMTNEEIDSIICDFIARQRSTTGETYLRGHFRAMGYTLQRRWFSGSLNRLKRRYALHGKMWLLSR